MPTTPHYEQGTYKCTIKGQGFDKSLNKGTPFFFLTVQPISWRRPDGSWQPLPENSYQRDVTMWLTEKTQDFVIGQLRDLGWAGTSFKDLDPENPGHHAFSGQEIELLCEHNTNPNTGKVYDQFRVAPPAAKPRESDGGLADQLDGLFGAALRATAGQAKVNPPVSKEEAKGVAASATRDDDVPF